MVRISMFSTLVDYVIRRNEGGDKLVKLKHDSGGWTRYGITSKVAKRHGIDVKEITKDQARMIYRKDYWNVNNLDNINSTATIYEIFDHGINRGVRTAAKLFQRSINCYNKSYKDVKALKVDGDIGPNTIRYYNRVKYKNNLVIIICGERLAEYKMLRYLHPFKFRKYFNTWVRRIGKFIYGA